MIDFHEAFVNGEFLVFFALVLPAVGQDAERMPVLADGKDLVAQEFDDVEFLQGGKRLSQVQEGDVVLLRVPVQRDQAHGIQGCDALAVRLQIRFAGIHDLGLGILVEAFETGVRLFEGVEGERFSLGAVPTHCQLMNNILNFHGILLENTCFRANKQTGQPDMAARISVTSFEFIIPYF